MEGPLLPLLLFLVYVVGGVIKSLMKVRDKKRAAESSPRPGGSGDRSVRTLEPSSGSNTATMGDVLRRAAAPGETLLETSLLEGGERRSSTAQISEQQKEAAATLASEGASELATLASEGASESVSESVSDPPSKNAAAVRRLLKTRGGMAQGLLAAEILGRPVSERR